MVLGLGKLKSGVQKMFRSSEDISNDSSKDAKKQSHASEKGRRRSLVLESHFSSPSGSSSSNVSTKLAALNLAETSTASTCYHDLNGDNANISVSGTFFRRKCLEESVEDEKENVVARQPSPSSSPSRGLGLGVFQKHNFQPTMGVQAKEMAWGIPRKRSRDLAEELKKARLRKSQSLSHLKFVNEEGGEIQHSFEYELDASDSESQQCKNAYPPVPKPRLSLLQKQDGEMNEANQTVSSGLEEKRPTIIPRSLKSSVSLIPSHGIRNGGEKVEDQVQKSSSTSLASSAHAPPSPESAMFLPDPTSQTNGHNANYQ